MIFVYGTTIFLALVFLLLLVPLSYTLSFERWKLDIKVCWLWGLISKGQTFSFYKPEDESGEPVEEGALAELDETLDAWEETLTAGEKEEAPSENGKKEEIKEIETPASPVQEEEPPLEKEEEPAAHEKSHPSYLAQLLFALDSGLAARCLQAAGNLISHGFIRKWHVEGGLGLGDPMHTGILCGLFYAFLPGGAEEISWNYVDKECTLSGYGRGRLIPLYVLYILLKLALSKPAREFWHFRQGGNDNG
ncbi:hypothetical protein [uncultured Dialister sp.]|uniref:hypothetical protein n=1 Tax=uncultured Dialister sp. TaxID=278064 RepID=UPI002629C812|nr:hypothetical protein [uncultured Dialister sp.]